jgi:hypothetical protein
LDRYFSFARDAAKLDFCAWQGNDYQVSDETWKDVNKKVKKYHEPDRFITYPGYEWSGNNPCGGDYNIYYYEEGKPIHRSSHWLLESPNDGSDRSILSDLAESLKNEKVLMIPHVGGRYGNIDFYNDKFTPVMEIHSHHGTFEWFIEDALEKGLKPGIIAASDDHTCRPGLSSPTNKTSRGLVSFDVNGGLTAVYAKELSREGIWEELKARSCYGTTGKRIILDMRFGENIMGSECETSDNPEFDIFVGALTEIKDIEIRRGTKTIYSYAQDKGRVVDNAISVWWSGVRSKTRSKKTTWEGTISVSGNSIRHCEKFAFNRPEENVIKLSSNLLSFNSTTSGDIDGIDINLNEMGGSISFETERTSFSVAIDDIKEKMIVEDAGGVNQRVHIDCLRKIEEKNIRFKYVDTDAPKGCSAYWVKVTQKDGNMAWSSPIYITKR